MKLKCDLWGIIKSMRRLKNWAPEVGNPIKKSNKKENKMSVLNKLQIKSVNFGGLHNKYISDLLFYTREELLEAEKITDISIELYGVNLWVFVPSTNEFKTPHIVMRNSSQFYGDEKITISEFFRRYCQTNIGLQMADDIGRYCSILSERGVLSEKEVEYRFKIIDYIEGQFKNAGETLKFIDRGFYSKRAVTNRKTVATTEVTTEVF